MIDKKQLVMDFIKSVNDKDRMREQDERLHNSVDYKYRVLRKAKDDMRGYCYDRICRNIYHDAIPLGPNYKSDHKDEIDDRFTSFIDNHAPDGSIVYYIREGLKKGSPFAKEIIEAVEKLVREEYHDKEWNIEDTPTKDLEFDIDDNDENQSIDDEIDDLSDENLSAPEISQKLYDITKRTAIDEISRAKENKERLQRLQDELSNDINMNNRAAVENALEYHGITTKSSYEPSIFEGMTVGMYSQLQKAVDEGKEINLDLGDALHPIVEAFYENVEEHQVENSLEKMAFVEAVEEFTALTMSKVLGLESYDLRDMRRIANEYSML